MAGFMTWDMADSMMRDGVVHDMTATRVPHFVMWDGVVHEEKATCPECGRAFEYLQPSGMCILCTARTGALNGGAQEPVPTDIMFDDAARCTVCHRKMSDYPGTVCWSCKVRFGNEG